MNIKEDIGLLRVRTIALKNQNPKEIENAKGEDGKYLPNVVLDLDYTVVIPKKLLKKSTKKKIKFNKRKNMTHPKKLYLNLVNLYQLFQLVNTLQEAKS